MMTRIAIGAVAGLICAMFSLATLVPSLASYFLIFLAPLAAFYVGLGWGVVASVSAVVSAVVALGALKQAFWPAVYAALGLAPVIWLSFLAGYWRPVTAAQGRAKRAWYPHGRLIVHTAILSAVVTYFGVILFDVQLRKFDATVLQILLKALGHVIAQLPWHWLALDFPVPRADSALLTAYLSAIVPIVLPLFAVVIWFCTLLFNFWAAATLARATQVLERPWPDMAMIRLPRFTILLFAGSVVCAVLSTGDLARFGLVLAAALALSFVLQGFAVMHRIVRPLDGARFVLAIGYLLCLGLIPLVIVFVTGLVRTAVYGVHGAEGAPVASDQTISRASQMEAST